MYRFFGDCQLNQFFLSETLIIGVGLILASLVNSIGKGLLPPALLFAYNTYLVYGAITNNPDGKCNVFAVQENQSECAVWVAVSDADEARSGWRCNLPFVCVTTDLLMLSEHSPVCCLPPPADQASIIAGCVISILSVTWAAYANAGKADQALTVQSRRNRECRALVRSNARCTFLVVACRTAHRRFSLRHYFLSTVLLLYCNAASPFPSGAQANANPMSGGQDPEGGKPGVQEWRQNSSGNVTTGASKGGDAASYQITSGGASAGGTGAGGDDYAEDEKPTNADRRPWLFHLIMALGGLYLGMAITNWGSADA